MAVAVLAVLAAGLALGPADVTVDVEAGRSVRVDCAPPVVSAWHDTGNRRLRLRATTGGNGEAGYTVSGGGEPWCAERARRRLAGAVALLTVAGIVVVVARRPGADSG